MKTSLQIPLTGETSTLHAEGTSILGAPHTILFSNILPRKNVHYGIMRPSGDKTSKTKYNVAYKLAYDEEAIRLLKHEYEIYSTDLQALQGTVIPTCYGLFTGTLGGAQCACLVLEFCDKAHHSPTAVGEEFYRKLMLAICKIHQAGIVHNSLQSRYHILQHGNEPRIVDFSKARRHNCRGAYPADRYGDLHRSPDVPWCTELAKMEEIYGMKSGAPPEIRPWAPASVPFLHLDRITQSFANIAFSG